jgi:hypothetical protein
MFDVEKPPTHVTKSVPHSALNFFSGGRLVYANSYPPVFSASSLVQPHHGTG